MIYTVTLNPAVDQTITINNFQIDQVNRVLTVREDAGGKGINVSKMIRNLKGESVALGIVGGPKGVFIEEQLKTMEIHTNFIKKNTNTRTNIKVVDTENHTFTDMNESGGNVDKGVIEAIEKQILATVGEDDFLVLAGSVPSNVDKNIYAKWIRLCKERKVKVILDADGDLLKAGVEAGPYLIKPNIHELEGLFGQKIKDSHTCIQLAKKLFQYGIEIIVVSMGAEGCLVITTELCINAKALNVPIKSTVGAGDSMVGALAYVLSNGGSISEATRLGVAASNASIQHEGTIMGSWDEIQDLRQQVELESIGV